MFEQTCEAVPEDRGNRKQLERPLGVLRNNRGSTWNFFYYVIYAGLATIVDFSVLFMLTDIVHVWYLASSIISYTSGMLTNYTLNKYLNFRNASKRILPQFGLFAFVALIGLLLNQLLLFVFVEYLGLWYLFAKVISVAIVMLWSFYGHKKLTFNVIK